MGKPTGFMEFARVAEDYAPVAERVQDYREFVAPYSRRILEAVEVPTIHFGTGVSTPLLEELARTGGDAIGLDWRTPLDAGWLVVGAGKAVQGNLEPAALLGPWERVEQAALDVLARAGGRPGQVPPRHRRQGTCVYPRCCPYRAPQ